MKKIILLFFLIFISCNNLFSTHIVGGIISYQCLGFNTIDNTISIRITLRVYRDAINGQAAFDNPAIVGVFEGSNITAYQILQLNNPVITDVPIELNNSCLSITPGSIAVEEAVYTTTLTLPYNANGYTFSYQRCCRNQTINNLRNPGSVGATYSIFLSGAAQSICNSSPNFNNYPPIVICNNQPIFFDHSASDNNNNTLVYSLCAPSTGGTQADPAPNPPTAPPYTLVPFGGAFSSGNPMPSNPSISINPNTGLLTGTPTQTGQYVVGVCVQEFDPSGQLLSTSVRDFQFNVINCLTTLNAAIRSDSIDASGQGFIVNSCNNNVITFINQSTASPQSLISNYEWRFDLNNGNFALSSATNPTITFPGPGQYTGWLVVNPGSAGCTDTAYITLNVYPPLVANFRNVIDSCNSSLPPIQYFDISTNSPSAPLNSWLWNFGDNTTSTLQNPTHQFPNAGTYNVSLRITDDNGCTDSIQRLVSWFPPANPQFTVDDPNGCSPHQTLFTHSSFPFTNTYTTLWAFGDGSSSSSSPTVSHLYQNPGNYTVSLQHISPWGCVSNLTRNNYITVFGHPIASFNYTYDSCEYTAVTFNDASTPFNTSSPISSWSWDFRDGTTSNLQNPSHLYLLAGTYPINLIVTDINGCTDTIQDSIQWYPKPVIDVQINSTTGCAPFSIFFNNQSYPINGYSTVWNFGDGNNSLLASPTHIYQNPGTYFVNLVITSPLGCRDTFRDTIIVFEPPTANFNFSFNTCVIEAVTFDETSTSNSNNTPILNYTWNFDDGTIISAQDTSHLYNLAGNFNVSLIIQDANLCSDTIVRTVSWFPAPIVAVDVSDSVGCQPLTVNFTNNSYPINGYTTIWNFGDGDSSSLASPTHVYDQYGNFIVHLFILSPTGCTGDFFDTIVVNQIPNADFTFSYDSCSFNGVTIFDQSSTNLAGNSITNWNWNYDAGFSANVPYSISDTLIPYNPRSNYTVFLQIIDENGCTDTISKLISYFPAPVFPVSSHSLEACLPVVVNFDNNPLNNYPGYNFLWDFGNGQSSNSFDTVYTYLQDGIFFPTLTVTTASGCIGVFKDTIVANGNPTANFDISYDPCELNGDVRFRNLSLRSNQGLIDSIFWNLGDGTISSQPFIFHQYNYPDTGFYQITLSVSDVNGCSDDSTYQFYWRPQPVFPIDLEDTRACIPLVFSIPNDNPYPISGYTTSWFFGDGRSSLEANPTIIYDSAGIYDLTLVVESPIGCIDTFTSVQTALENPEAGFTYTPSATEIDIYNAEVSFFDQSQRARLWRWNFGDNNWINNQNPTYTFRDTGLVNITQVVYHQNGCTDTASIVLDIKPRISYFLPNAFTPNDDGLNDEFLGTGYLQYIRNFEMAIYNRWGERIYENNSPYESWNGRKFNTGEKCQAGVYVVIVRFEGPRGEKEEIKGFATIVY